MSICAARLGIKPSPASGNRKLAAYAAGEVTCAMANCDLPHSRLVIDCERRQLRHCSQQRDGSSCGSPDRHDQQDHGSWRWPAPSSPIALLSSVAGLLTISRRKHRAAWPWTHPGWVWWRYCVSSAHTEGAVAINPRRCCDFTERWSGVSINVCFQQKTPKENPKKKTGRRKTKDPDPKAQQRSCCRRLESNASIRASAVSGLFHTPVAGKKKTNSGIRHDSLGAIHGHISFMSCVRENFLPCRRRTRNCRVPTMGGTMKHFTQKSRTEWRRGAAPYQRVRWSSTSAICANSGGRQAPSEHRSVGQIDPDFVGSARS